MQDWKLAQDLTVNRFENVAMNLFDLYRARLSKGDRMIEGITFVNCRLEGPAVLAVLGGCDFDGTDLGRNVDDVRSIVLRSASPNAVVGALPIRDCRFVGCQLFAVGYTGPEAFLEQLLALQTRP